MKHETVAILCSVVLVFTILIIDFDAANTRWCETYPELCTPDQTEIAKSSEGSC